ncbi:MAG TPA: hypothetical protein VG797_01740 [Phycisphaerales bacterium]|nr:hypothetical protein [Phycisphaerales bacterium]
MNKTGMISAAFAASVFATASVSLARGFGGDLDDVFVGIESGRLTTSRILDDGMGGFGGTEPYRVFPGEFGETGFPGFADDPGYFSDGVLPEGLSLGFNILDAARVWNGSDFDTVSLNTVTLGVALGLPGFPTAVTPTTAGEFVAGFPFALTSEGGFMHQHLEMQLSDPDATGVYLLQFELYIADQRGSTATLPYWFVMNNGADEAEHDAAIAYAESLVPAPGTGFMLLGGLVSVRRRRRAASDR